MEGLVDLAVIRECLRRVAIREVARWPLTITLVLCSRRNEMPSIKVSFSAPRGITNQSASGNSLASSSTAVAASHLKPCGYDGCGERLQPGRSRKMRMENVFWTCRLYESHRHTDAKYKLV